MKRSILFFVFLLTGYCVEAVGSKYVYSHKNQVVDDPVLNGLVNTVIVAGTYGAVSYIHRKIIDCMPGRGFNKASKVDVVFSRVSGMAAAMSVFANACGDKKLGNNAAAVMVTSMLMHIAYKGFSMPAKCD